MILRDNNGVTEEPFESLVVEVPENQTGPVMEMTGQLAGSWSTCRGTTTILTWSFRFLPAG